MKFTETFEGMNKPYHVKAEALEKGTYVRLGRSTVRATADMIEELKWQSRGISFDMRPVYHATLEDLDRDKISAYLELKSRRGAKTIHTEQLLANHLAVEEHARAYPTVAGILLFGKAPERFFPEGIVITTHFAGISGREVISSRDCGGTLIEQLDAAHAFIRSNLNVAFSIKGMRRKDQLEIPEVAIREILVNAIAHRNYHIQSPTKIAIYANRIEFFSPGSFPGPINPNNLTMGLTYIRNLAISRVLREMGIMEKLGSGFIAMFDAYSKAGLPVPEVVEGENFVKCILPRRQVVPHSHKKSARPASSQDPNEMRIMALLERAHDITVTDVMASLGTSRATAGRQLKALVDRGLLMRHGSGRTSVYARTSRGAA